MAGGIAKRRSAALHARAAALPRIPIKRVRRSCIECGSDDPRALRACRSPGCATYTCGRCDAGGGGSCGRCAAEAARADPTYAGLNAGQRRALARILAGRGSFLVAGEAGTGKTHLLVAAARALEARGARVARVAWGGVAAQAIGGETMARHFGLGRGAPEAEVLARAAQRPDPWRVPDVLIVDEVSTVPGSALELVDRVARAVRERPGEPFGGLRVLFFGDFYQLPPVGEAEWDEARGELVERPEAYAFETAAWAALGPELLELEEPMRQADADFVLALRSVRRGRVDAHAMRTLDARLARAPPADDAPTHLYASNRRVDEENARRSELAPGEARTYRAVRIVAPGREDAARAFLDRLRVPETLQLKVGTPVLFTTNSPEDPAIRNGTSGIVAGFEAAPVLRGPGPDADVEAEWAAANRAVGGRCPVPLVRVADGRLVRARPHVFAAEGRIAGGGPTRVFGRLAQVPVRVAHALTVSRSQGTTLDAVCVSIDRHTIHLPGQAYVALSRARTLDRLYLDSFDPSLVRADPRVLAWEERARQLQASAAA